MLEQFICHHRDSPGASHPTAGRSGDVTCSGGSLLAISLQHQGETLYVNEHFLFRIIRGTLYLSVVREYDVKSRLTFFLGVCVSRWQAVPGRR